MTYETLFNEVNQLNKLNTICTEYKSVKFYSLAMAMGMLHQGTSGETEKEIGATIFKGLSKDVVAKKLKQLRQVNLFYFFYLNNSRKFMC